MYIYGNYESDNIFIIGGASIYKQLLPYCKYAYVTKIEDSKEAEVFFPNLDKEKDWYLNICDFVRVDSNCCIAR